MRSGLFLPLLPLLLGAAPLPTVTPPDPPLGRPCTVVIPLPDPDTTLAGLPALGAFELLLPPRHDGTALRLVLLPLRPGPQALPALTLQTATGLVTTAPLPLTVVDDLPAELTPAPLLQRPSPSSLRRWGGLALLPLAGLLVLAALRLRRRSPAATPPPPDEELAALARRLAALPREAGVGTLLGEIERLRFAPVPPDGEELATLLRRGRRLLGESP